MKKAYMVIALLVLNLMFGSLAYAPAQTATDKQKLNTAILIFEGVQIIDYTGPYEVLGSWGHRNVYTVAEKSVPITTAMGMRVIPNYTFDNQPRPDVIIVPGGGGVNQQIKNQKVIDWILENAKQAR